MISNEGIQCFCTSFCFLQSIACRDKSIQDFAPLTCLFVVHVCLRLAFLTPSARMLNKHLSGLLLRTRIADCAFRPHPGQQIRHL